jgi:hypothetical protein
MSKQARGPVAGVRVALQLQAVRSARPSRVAVAYGGHAIGTLCYYHRDTTVGMHGYVFYVFLLVFFFAPWHGEQMDARSLM